MEYSAFKDEVIRQAKAAGLTEYELYYESSEDVSASAFQHEVSEFTGGVSGGVCFRAVVNGKMGYASTEELSEAQAAAIVSKAVENAASLETEAAVFLCEGGKTYQKLELTPYPLPTTDQLISTMLATQEKLYAADPAVVDGCTTNAISEKLHIAICNSKGLDLEYENNISGLVVSAVVTDGKEMADDYDMKLGRLEEIDTDSLTSKAVKEALSKLGGDVAPTAVCPVVFAPSAMASLLRTFSSIFSSESAQKGLSRLGDKEGSPIASEAVTLVDDPFSKDSPVPIHFDAEGSPTRTKKVIENGRLTTLLYNLETAAAAGKETTGNASKAGYSAPVKIQPFTMYLAPGSLTEEDLLQKAGSGVYINSLGGLHAGANPVSGDFSLQSAGFLIEDGKKTIPVKSFTVAGNFYDLLQKITALADEVKFPMATGMTSFGSPAVLVEALSIAGK